jgi:hypothetical protein
MTASSATCASAFVASVVHYGFLGLGAVTALGIIGGTLTTGAVSVIRLSPNKHRVLVFRHYMVRVLILFTVVLFLVIGLTLYIEPYLATFCSAV